MGCDLPRSFPGGTDKDKVRITDDTAKIRIENLPNTNLDSYFCITSFGVVWFMVPCGLVV
jgi:hypothetical protein